MPKTSSEFQTFTALTDRLLRVPKATVDARLAAYNAERAKIPSELKPGRNPKPKRPVGRDKGEA
jgi:hypothetical protein